MPRKRAVAAIEPPLEDVVLDGLDDQLIGLGQDPAPSEPRRSSRAPRAKAAPAKKAVGRPRNPVRTSSGRSMTLDQMKAKVYTELLGFSSLIIAAWEMKDPVCAGVWSEPTIGGDPRLNAAVFHTVEILAHSRPTIEFLANSGAIGSGLMLAATIGPAVKTVIKHHGPTGVGHEEEKDQADYAAHYPAYTGKADGR